MNRTFVDPIADAVLYEGYILYPYRPSTKNRQRWSFGGLYPEAYGQLHVGHPSTQTTECLVLGDPATRFEAVVRFLHLTSRQVGAIEPAIEDWPSDPQPAFRLVESLQVGDRTYHAWQEAEAREAVIDETTLEDLTRKPIFSAYRFPGGRRLEPIPGAGGTVVGVLVRVQREVVAEVEVRALELEPGLFRLTLTVANQTPMNDPEHADRDEALLGCLASTHAILGVADARFVSLMDPPEPCREAAAACRNVGAWPVLVGIEGRADTMLSAPIILYDYPKVAPESPGDYFDGTEMDEMLTLRIRTLTDVEKGAMADVDDRARDLLARTEALARDQMLGLHGALRDLRPSPTEVSLDELGP